MPRTKTPADGGNRHAGTRLAVHDDPTVPVASGKRAPLLVNALDAATMLAISPRKLWELTNCGEIPCVRIGRAVRYKPVDLHEWIASHWRIGHV